MEDRIHTVHSAAKGFGLRHVPDQELKTRMLREADSFRLEDESTDAPSVVEEHLHQAAADEARAACNEGFRRHSPDNCPSG